jgi:hypothetical protein
LEVPEKSGKLDFFNPLKALYRVVTAIHGKSQKIKLLLFASFWQSMNCLLPIGYSGCQGEVFHNGHGMRSTSQAFRPFPGHAGY